MLRVTEQILLLLLNDGEGNIASSVPQRSLNTLLAGSVLIDLSFENRIDTDLDQLMLVDSTPIGDDLLDPTLADIAAENCEHPIAYWIERTAKHGDEILRKTISRLVGYGILQSDDPDLVVLSQRVSRSRLYPAIDGKVTEEIQLRIMRLLFSQEIPDPHDVIIVSLVNAAGVFKHILSRSELAQARDRIDLISRLDPIGQSVTDALRTMEEPPPSPRTKEIPEVSGLPLIGSVFNLIGDLRVFLTREYRKLGPVFRIRALNRRIIALVGPEANVFLQKHGRNLLRSYETWRDFIGAFGAKDALMGMDGPGHVRMRRVHARSFSRGFAEDHLDKMVDITQGAIAQWPQNQPVSVQFAMQSLIADQIALLTTGVSASRHIEDLIAALDGLLGVHVRQQVPKWFLRMPRQRRACRRMEELCKMVLAHHEGKDGKTGDLIDDLLELHHANPQFFPETDMQIAVLGPFFAGIETTANTCSLILYALLKHPELLERVTAEAEAFFDHRPPEAQRLHEMDVTHRVAMETMRMYPVIPGIPRTVTNSFKFAGYTVPAGANVIIGNTVPHHLPECFPNPERFDIDRYTPERAEHRQPGAFAPFGLGTHRCLGSGLAEVQMAITLLTIVHNAEITLDPPGYELKIKWIPAPHPARSFKFRVRHRTPQRPLANEQ